MTSTDHDSMGQLLRTAFDVFESIRELARSCENSDPDLLPAFMSAATAAADGRDAVAGAPALTAGTGSGTAAAGPGSGEDAQDAADVIAVLAAALTNSLTDGASQAATAGDRRACQDAAAAARQIAELMGRRDDRHAR
jgi:hypothetical protein